MIFLGKKVKIKPLFSLAFLLWCLLDHGLLCVGSDRVSVMEGDSVTLNTDDEMKQKEDRKWYFKGICIAQITGDLREICTDDQCKERFRDRLKLDHQTGSLTITNTRNTDSGDYQLQINSSISEKIFSVAVHGVGSDEVSVMEGDSVTLYTGVETNQQDRIRWYFNDTRIAQINRDQSKICTDVQCNNGTERFRDRLKLDHQTGSLTITNIRMTDSGEYQLQISSGSSDSEKTFIIALYGAAEREEMRIKSVMEGESVTLDPAVIRKLNDVMTWYFNDILVAKISADRSKTCTDDQCKERFRDRLEMNQTGSLTVRDTRTEDTGLYKLQFNSSRFSIIRSFSLTVIAVPDSGLHPAEAAGICVVLVFAVVVVGMIYYRYRNKARQKGSRILDSECQWESSQEFEGD